MSPAKPKPENVGQHQQELHQQIERLEQELTSLRKVLTTGPVDQGGAGFAHVQDFGPLASLLRDWPVPLVIVRETTGVVERVSEELLHMTGYAYEELIGHDAGMLYHNPADRKRLLGELQHQGIVRDLELPVRHANGQPIAVLINSNRILFDGEPAILTCLVDIAERHRMELATRQSQLLLTDAMETMPEGLAIFNRAGKLVTFNTLYQQLMQAMGLSPREGMERATLTPANATLLDPEPNPDDMDAGEPRKRYAVGTRWIELRAEETSDRMIVEVHRDVTAELAEAEALRSREAWLQGLIDSLPVPVAITRKHDGRLLYHNRALADLMETGQEEINGQHSLRFYKNPNDRETLLKIVEEQGVVENFPVEFRTAKDNLRHTLISEIPLTYQGEEALLVSLMDMTEIMDAQQVVWRQQQLLKTVFDTIPHGMFVKDLEGRFLMVNAPLAEVANKTPEEIQGQIMDSAGFGNEAEREAFKAQDAKVIATNTPVEVPDYTLTLPDGRMQRRRMVKYPLRDAGGAVTGIVGLSEDITHIKESEARLEASEANARLLMEYASDGILIVDGDLRVVMANPSASRLTGYLQDELIGMTYPELITPQSLKKDPIPHEQLRQGKAIMLERELATKSGTAVFVEAAARALPNGNIFTILRDVTARREAEQKLQETRHLLQSMFDTVPYWIFIKDTQARYLMVNQHMADFYGRSPEEAVGLNYQALSEGLDIPGLEDSDASDWLILNGESSRQELSELELIRPDGGLMFRRVLKVPMKDHAGNITGIIGISEDITEARLASRELEQVETRFRNLTEHSFHGVMIHRQGKPLYANPAYAEIFGYANAGEILALESINNLLHPDDKERLTGYYRDRMAGREDVPSFYDFRGIKKDGSIRHLEASASLVDWGGGKAMQVLINDVTERREAAAQLERSERSLAAAQQVARMGSLDWDLVHNVQYWSDEIYRLAGHPPQGIPATAENFAKMVHPDDKPRVLASIMRTVNEGVPFHEECRVLHADGHEMLVIGRGEIVPGPDGRPARMVGTVQDVTERTIMERQLRQAQKLESLGTLAGGIAHDLNNILFPIMGYAELLIKNLPKDGEEYSFATMISQSAYRAKDLVSQVLLFARSSEKQFEPCMLRPVAKEVMKLMRATLPTTIRIEENIGENVDMVLADGSQMHQLIMNLCINAGQAMEQGGTLTISLENVHLHRQPTYLGEYLSGPHVRLTCSDTGVGMNQETLSRMFEPFFTTKGVGQGTGLGLTTVFGIVTQHSGGIQVRSTEGKGTTFEIYLPSWRAPASVEPPTKQFELSGSETIMVIDDEIPITALATSILNRLGYTIEAYNDSVQALERIRANPEAYDLIITDKTMPGITGEILAMAVKEVRADLPVILCTGHSERLGQENAREYGIDEILIKPIGVEKLGLSVRTVLDKARAQADAT